MTSSTDIHLSAMNPHTSTQPLFPLLHGFSLLETTFSALSSNPEIADRAFRYIKAIRKSSSRKPPATDSHTPKTSSHKPKKAGKPSSPKKSGKSKKTVKPGKPELQTRKKPPLASKRKPTSSTQQKTKIATRKVRVNKKKFLNNQRLELKRGIKALRSTSLVIRARLRTTSNKVQTQLRSTSQSAQAELRSTGQVVHNRLKGGGQSTQAYLRRWFTPKIGTPNIQLIKRTPRVRKSQTSDSPIHMVGEMEHRCPYCLEAVDKNDPRGIKICPICQTHHHADCWAVTGICQVPHHHG